MKKRFQFKRWFIRILLITITASAMPTMQAALFSGIASISANDGTGALSASSANSYGLTVSCWFRISIPSSTNLTENMVILMDRSDGNEAASFSYEIRFNAFNGSVEFLARGDSGAITNTLIVHPYLDRWYHVAVVRQQSAFIACVDGRQLTFFPSTSIGNAVGNGLSVGGIAGNSRLFMGDIVEVAVYQTPLSPDVIRDRMFKDQRAKQTCTQRALGSILNLRSRRFDQPAIGNARRARRFADPAGQAQVEVLDVGIRDRRAVGHLPHLENPSARRIHLYMQFPISRARVQAQAAVDALVEIGPQGGVVKNGDRH